MIYRRAAMLRYIVSACMAYLVLLRLLAERFGKP